MRAMRILAFIVVLAVIVAGYMVISTTKAAETVTVTTTMRETVMSTVASTTTVTITSHIEEKEIVVVDALGNRVTLREPAKRIVSLAPSITEEVCILGFCNRLVGVDSFSLSIEGVPDNVTDVGGFWQPSTELVVSTKPDLVFACSGVPHHYALGKQLESLGVNVFFLKCNKALTVEDIYWDLRSIATLLGEPSLAEKVVEDIERSIREVSEKVANTTKPKVALVVYMDEKSIWVSGGGTFQDYIINIAGATNVFSNLYAWQMVSPEDLIAANPDYVLVTAMTSNDTDKIAKIFSETILSELDAYKNDRVCVLFGKASDKVNRPSPGIVDAIRLIAHILHRDLVPEPESLKDSYVCIGAR